ncbi:MAG: excinuclease ABC subunit UvrA [Planctomycetaceae bacterium]|nr:excinuclease ABC subunit UvrA [Planctomycetaceae bacterium]
MSLEISSLARSVIQITGARTHNLRDIEVRIPRQALTVITGVSGSGKSSLAFHTLFAEGQRRLLRTLSGRSRSWLAALPRPDVDSVAGLPPVIAVRQEQLRPGPRSTVANITEVLDYLRVLYARSGVVYCPQCQIAVVAQTCEQIISSLLQHPAGTKMLVLAPLVRETSGDPRQMLERIAREGFVRARINGEIVELGETGEYNAPGKHSIDVVVDRLILREDIRSRLAESVGQALRIGNGSCIACIQQSGEWLDSIFQTHLCCPRCDRTFPPLEPALFSWSTPQGACPVCTGTGQWQTLPATTQDEFDEAEEDVASVDLRGEERQSCPACKGRRLNEFSSHVRVAGITLPDLLSWPLPRAEAWLRHLSEQATSPETSLMLRQLTEPLLYRMEFLRGVGLSYLSLDRAADTLSGGERQRARLARCLGTQLQGSCYMLDEPTAGLHAHDADRLIEILRRLSAEGNTVICVEHNLRVVLAADHVIELGPGGGRAGGEVIFQGSPAELRASTVPTGIAIQQAESPRGNQPAFQVTPSELAAFPLVRLNEARLHNLKSVSIQFPLKHLICVTGVSGSGKSTLILDALAPLVREAVSSQSLHQQRQANGQLSLDEPVTQLNIVDQSPPAKQSRSCPATYSGMWQDVQKILARTRAARIRGFGSGRFSIHSRQGTCPECQGRGEMQVKLSLLAENRMICPVCRGRRFNPATLTVKYQGRDCAELLRMTIDEALEFWSEYDSIVRKLKPFQEIGIGYLSLGQTARSLSGGEAQRMKLALELALPRPGSLLILDEPTSGLHWRDVSRLIDCLRRLVKSGSSIIVIEHHPLMLSASDWHIELGPGAAEQGGEILYCGPRNT